MTAVTLQPAFILHRRAYRETSLLIELWTPAYGRLSVLAKGARSSRQIGHHLQLFAPLLVSWYGRGELMNLTHAETQGAPVILQGDCLFAGFYLNELLINLLPKWDAHPLLYSTYSETVFALQTTVLDQRVLRVFEKRLLEAIGYGFFQAVANTAAVDWLPQGYYRFIPDHGFVLQERLTETSLVSESVFSGESLLAMMREDWQDAQSLREAKRLTRCVLSALLGTRPIYSRQLFTYVLKEEPQ